jgi:hypothetical protein
MKRLTVLNIALALAIFSFLLVPSAHATAAIRIFDGATCTSAGSNCVTIDDSGNVTINHGTVCATGSGCGTIVPTLLNGSGGGGLSVSVKLGVFTTNTEIGSTKPLLPTATEMDLTTQNITSTGSGTLHVQFSDINFLLQPSFAMTNAGGTLNASKNTLTFNTYWSATNNLFANTNLMTNQSFNTAHFSGTAAGGAINTSPYSLMEELVITTTGTSTLSGDFDLTIVPEPASVILLGGILAVTARTIRRRAKKA